MTSLSESADNLNNEGSSLVETQSDRSTRINHNNPYLNKHIKFTDGTIAYVTNKGIAKKLSYNTTATPLNVNIPWSSTFNTPNTSIPTTPKLLSGTPLDQNKSFGYEGGSIVANKMITNTNAKYTDKCVVADTNTTFLGSVKPMKSTNSAILNGDFSQPSNIQFEYVGSWSWWGYTKKVVNWDCVGGVYFINLANGWWSLPKIPSKQGILLYYDASISQTITLSQGQYTLMFKVCGGLCCDGTNNANAIDVLLNDVKVGASITPVVGQSTSYTRTLNVTTPGHNKITFKTQAVSRLSVIYDVSLDGEWTTGGYTYDSCKQQAIAAGSQYFGLQERGFCSLTDQSMNMTTSNVITSAVALWSLNTTGLGGTVATLTGQGSLTVVKPDGSKLNPTTSSDNTDYIGCYADQGSRAMPTFHQVKSVADCRTAVGNKKYYGIQYAQGTTTGECWSSDDLTQVKKYGKASNCQKVGGNYFGGSWSNAVYTKQANETKNFYVYLQDDGNMITYRGSDPNTDNQGMIWQSATAGKKDKPNPQYAAAKGKYGRPWMHAGDTLAQGEFIGSMDGSIFLIMQSDGNLVLYASSSALNCKMENGNMVGGVGAVAVHELAEVGDKNFLGKRGYVSEDSEFYETTTSSNNNVSVDTNQLKKYKARSTAPPEWTLDMSQLQSVQSQTNREAVAVVKHTNFLNTDINVNNDIMDKNTKSLLEPFSTINNYDNIYITVSLIGAALIAFRLQQK